MAGPTSNGTNERQTSRISSKTLRPGIYVPTVAFFDAATDDVDLVTVGKHATYLAGTGIAGIVTHGSNGEAVHLDREERKAINSTTRQALDAAGCSNLPVIVGCGAASTRETIQLCKDVSQSGGSFALVLPPSYYNSLVSSDLLLEHFRAVADASPIPVLIYNFPGAASGLDMNSDQILALSQHPNIVGTKLTCGNTGKLARIAASAKPEFVSMGGSADFILQTMVVGGHGVIAGLANLAPRSCVQIFDLYQQGRLAEARKLQAVVARGDWVTIKGGFVAVKVLLQQYRGYGGAPRKPTALPATKGIAAMRMEFEEMIGMEKTLE